MASPNIYSSGIGGSTGDELCSLTNLAVSGDVWYVLSSTGTDAATPAGKERIKPLATLAQAYTNAAAGDTITFLAGHQETLTGVQTLAKAGLRLVSEGTGLVNSARFTCNGSMVLFDITAAGVWLGNIYFAASTTAPTPSRVRIASAATKIRGCYFACGASDTAPALSYVTGAGTARVEDTTFISTASSLSAQAHSALNVANAMSDLVLDTVVFDGGSTGWSQPFAVNVAAAVTRLTATNIDLLHDSDITVATGSIYTFHIRNKSGSARMVLTA